MPEQRAELGLQSSEGEALGETFWALRASDQIYCTGGTRKALGSRGSFDGLPHLPSDTPQVCIPDPDLKTFISTS